MGYFSDLDIRRQEAGVDTEELEDYRDDYRRRTGHEISYERAIQDLARPRFREGYRVQYHVPQHTHTGKITKIGKTKRGGDCLVKWDRSGNESEECFINLTEEVRP